MKTIDFSLYLVTDKKLSNNGDTEFVVEQAIKGGATIVQVRCKNEDTVSILSEAQKIKVITDKYSIPLIINDRIDIALAVDADGVHLGQSDMPISFARKLLGANKIIGISVDNVYEAEEAEKNGADYIAINGVFPTSTKTNITSNIGTKGITEIASMVSIPIIGIGGINDKNASEVIEAGCSGIAVVSFIASANSPKDAAKELKDIIQKTKHKKNV